MGYPKFTLVDHDGLFGTTEGVYDCDVITYNHTRRRHNRDILVADLRIEDMKIQYQRNANVVNVDFEEGRSRAITKFKNADAVRMHIKEVQATIRELDDEVKAVCAEIANDSRTVSSAVTELCEKLGKIRKIEAGAQQYFEELQRLELAQTFRDKLRSVEL